MSAVPAIWKAVDEQCKKCGIGGNPMPKNNLKPSWSYTTSEDEIKIIESEHANWELLWNGKTMCHSSHPANLIRWAYEKHLIDYAKVVALSYDLGIPPCYSMDSDR